LAPAGLSAQAFADPAFEKVWQRTDKPIAEGRVARSWMWGPQPFTEGMQEPYAESPGGSRLVQYFDKSRMEINDPGGDPSSMWYVTNGLLVREMVDGRIQIGDAAFEDRGPAQEAVAGDPVANNPNCPTYGSFTYLTWDRADNRLGQKATATLARDATVGDDASKGSYAGTEIAYYEEATGHNVPKALWDFMNQSGLIYLNGSYQNGKVVDWLFAMGYPISEPYWTRCTVGGEEKDVLVQLFERRVLTYTPSNQAGWQVEMGNVGQHYYNWRYGPAGPPTQPPPGTPPPAGTPGCPATPPDVDGTITPKCGTTDTEYKVDVWGFQPNEKAGCWVNDPNGVPIAGTWRTYRVRSDGTDTWYIWPDDDWDPGLYSVVVEGVTSGHQSITWFTILGETTPPASCADVLPDVNGSITPKCGGWSTRFCMDAWGFSPNEQVGFWLDSQYGIIGGTYRTYSIGPTGTLDDFCFEPKEDWIGIDRPGLYWWVFEGTSSGNQAIMYWVLEE
jgi:hypothetical protein